MRDNKTLFKNTRVYLFLFFCAGLLLYFNSLHNPFIWDDQILVVNNPAIRDIHNLAKAFATDISFGRQPTSSYRPLVNVSFILDYSLWRLDASGYHLTNILLHIATSFFLFYLLASCLAQGRLFSLLVSLLFLVHPLQTNVVTYISGRADALTGLFLILAVIGYIKFINGKRLYLAYLSALFFFFALCSKEMAFTFPFIILLYEYVFLDKGERAALRQKRIYTFAAKNHTIYGADGFGRSSISPRGIPEAFSPGGLNFYGLLLLVCLAYLGLRLAALRSFIGLGSHFYPSLAQRLLPIPIIFCRYLRLLLLPYGLSLSHIVHMPFSIFEPQTLAAIFLWLIFIIFSLRSIHYCRVLFFGLAWFFIHLLAVSNLIPLNAYMAEDWLYLPSMGFFIGLVALGFKLNKRLFIFVLCLSLPVYAWLTFQRNLDYNDPVKFYQKTLIYSPRNFKMYHNLGILYLDRAETDLAIAAFEDAIRFKPDFAESFLGLGFAYQKKGRSDIAESCYNKALRIKPGLKEIKEYLANLK